MLFPPRRLVYQRNLDVRGGKLAQSRAPMDIVKAFELPFYGIAVGAC